MREDVRLTVPLRWPSREDLDAYGVVGTLPPELRPGRGVREL